jgi:hypothetical protein
MRCPASSWRSSERPGLPARTADRPGPAGPGSVRPSHPARTRPSRPARPSHPARTRPSGSTGGRPKRGATRGPVSAFPLFSFSFSLYFLW